MENNIEVKNLSFSYDKKKTILNNISFDIEKGKITSIIGANGCGKSTLFNLISKNLKPQQGEIKINGVNLKDIRLKQLALQLAVVHQYNTAPPDLKVETLVGYGRIPYGRKNADENEKYITSALETMAISDLRKRNLGELSGGQRQRAWVAMALAQNTDILLLDEMTNSLDIKHQIETLRLIKKLNCEKKITVVMILHDINQAIAYSDKIIAMKDGKIIKDDVPQNVITDKTLKTVYDIDLKVDKIDGRSVVIPV